MYFNVHVSVLNACKQPLICYYKSVVYFYRYISHYQLQPRWPCLGFLRRHLGYFSPLIHDCRG